MKKIKVILEASQQRAKAVPIWIRVLILLFAFGLPILWIFQKDSPYYFILSVIVSITGPDENLIHLLALLLTIVLCLIPLGLLIQLLGNYFLKRSFTKNSK